MRLRNAALTALAALLIAGCTPVLPEPGPADTPTASPSEEPAPEPSPEPGAEARADYGFLHFKEAEIGQTWDEMSVALRYPVAGMEMCPHFGSVWQTERAYGAAFMDPDGINRGAMFFSLWMNLDASPDHYPRNAEGIGLGSTLAEVLAAYPSAVESVYTDIGAGDLHLITVDDPDSDSKYVFARYADDSMITMMQWGPWAGRQWSHLCTGH